MSTHPVKTFIKTLDGLDRSLSTRDKFRDMMELGYCAFAKLTAGSKERADELEARYMSIVNRYQNKDTIRAYKPLLDLAWETVESGHCDFLGDVSSQLEVLNAGQGQFFTPFNVSQMMAEITLSDVGAVIEREGFVKIAEPACGAGGMILAAADVIQKQGYNPMIHMLVNAVDVSPLCYHMTFLQLTWRGVPALVQRMNSLSLELFESAYTPHITVFHNLHGRLFESRPGDSEPMQLSLFDFAEYRELREEHAIS